MPLTREQFKIMIKLQEQRNVLKSYRVLIVLLFVDLWLFMVILSSFMIYMLNNI